MFGEEKVDMKNKILCIFACLNLITIVIPSTASTSNLNSSEGGIHYLPDASLFEENNKIKNQSIDELEYIIIRDGYGVPHVFADTKEGLAFGAGYAVAQDRLWQLDVFRRQATGRLAEFDLVSIDYDYLTRVRGYSKQENTELFLELKSPYKEMLTAYTEGINLYIIEALDDPLNKMPFEYLDKGLSPEPWTEEDFLA